MNYDALADQGMAEASAEDRAMVAQPTPFKDAWAAKVAPGLTKARGIGDAYRSQTQDDPSKDAPMYEDPRQVVANYNLADLVKLYSAG